MSHGAPHSIARPAAWIAATGASFALLYRSGARRPELRLPVDPRSWSRWAITYEPLDVAAGVARTIALVIVGYLLVIAVLHLLAALVPRAGMRRVASVATPRFLVGAVAGIAVLAGAGTAGARPADDRAPGDAPVMRVIEPTTTSTTAPAPGAPTVGSSRPVAPSPTAPTTSTPPDPAGRSVATTSTTASAATTTSDMSTRSDPERPTPPRLPSPPTSPSEMVPSATPAPETSRAAEHVVTVGEHLWSIAEHTTAQRLGTSPSATQVAGYWHRLIEANRDRLVDPDDPGLILPGQTLVLPD